MTKGINISLIGFFQVLFLFNFHFSIGKAFPDYVKKSYADSGL